MVYKLNFQILTMTNLTPKAIYIYINHKYTQYIVIVTEKHEHR